ncbi:pilus assembly FimT family protein [Reinekea thalattae]|uniref:Type II secretion system protein n=1 Tax=Reinekea thalattae TaxID=2593301 RepID=A0A5C8ZAM7_9GAMM|nr:type II secretion system protein [Reinekea thalattae]TXR54329.1 type II secretion system protein [Reinekea thalattae]
MFKKNKGFTLTELVLVIVILSIIVALAVPRFVNSMKRDTRIALLKGMEGTVKTAAELVRKQAVVNGKTTGQDSIEINGAAITIHSGYPIGHWMYSMRYLINQDSVVFLTAAKVCELEWCGRGYQKITPSGVRSTEGRIVKVYPYGFSWNDECGVYYVNHQDGREPVIGLETDDC